MPVLLIGIHMLDALEAPEADLVVEGEAISCLRTDSLLPMELAHSYLTFPSNTLTKWQNNFIKHWNLAGSLSGAKDIYLILILFFLGSFEY